MKKIFFCLFLAIGFAGIVNAQKWSDLSNEQKVSKLKEFREDNQQYLKTTLGMSQDQLDDIDNVNLCFLGALDRIDRYGKDDAGKEKWAKSAVQARSAQLDAIMGTEKRKQFQAYVEAKLKKAQATQGK